MAISISNYPVYLQDGLKLDRDCLKSQESQNEGRKVFDRDSLKVSQLSDKMHLPILQFLLSAFQEYSGILRW